MNTLRFVAVALLIGCLPQPAVAAPFDGSSPLLCSVSNIRECLHRGDCQRRVPEDVNFPPFLRIDTKAATLATVGGAAPRSAPIHRMEVVNTGLILHGGQEGRGWSAVIAGDTGRLSAGVVDDDGGFMIFGACTPLAQ